MIRLTSIECYNQIKAEGLLSKKRMEVYEVLFKYGAQTGSQIAINHRKLFGGASTISETIRNRVTELYYMKVVEEVGVVRCPISKRNVIQWRLTNNLPEKYEKPTSKKDKIIKLKKMLNDFDKSGLDMFQISDFDRIIYFVNKEL